MYLGIAPNSTCCVGFACAGRRNWEVWEVLVYWDLSLHLPAGTAGSCAAPLGGVCLVSLNQKLCTSSYSISGAA